MKVLEDESEVVINWFSVNNMIFSLGKFQIMILYRAESIKDKYTLKMNDKDFVTKSLVTLLGVEI